MKLSCFRANFFAAIFFAGLIFPIFSSNTAHACACCGSYQVVGVAKWDVLNVRSGPGVGYRVIGSLLPGEACVVKTGERRGRWVRIGFRGTHGWVNGRFLAILR